MNSIYYESHQLMQASGLIRTEAVHRSSRWVLPRDARLYLARSNALADISAEHSKVLTAAVENAILTSFSQVRTGLYPESVDFSLVSAGMAGANFVIYPKLLHWDDKLGSWSEIIASLRNDSSQGIVSKFGLDRVVVQIIILDVASGSLVDFVQVEAGSGLLSLYGDQPGSLLLPVLQAYFEKLALTTG
ncbi:MAG: DUF4823 domain-containing protein [Proteobacteria bacterium]|nr:DUF4823 domain-containing protein [Pseudomonadota bacterium]